MHAWAEVCHLLQSNKSPPTGFLCSIGWRITGFLQTLLHTNCISNSVILRKNYISICAHAYTWRKNGVVKEAIVASVSGSNRLMWLQTCEKVMGWCTAQWKMLLFCAKTIVKESCKFELARLKKKKKKKEKKKKKKKKEKHFDHLVTFWFSTFVMLFSTTWCVFRHENTRRWTVGCCNGL